MSGLTRFCELHRYEQQVALEARQLAIPRSDANLLFLPQLLQNGQCCSQGTQGNHTARVHYREGRMTRAQRLWTGTEYEFCLRYDVI